MDRFGLGQEELGRRFDKSKSWVSRRLSLVADLPTAIQDSVRQGKLGAHAAMKYFVPLARANEEVAVIVGGESGDDAAEHAAGGSLVHWLRLWERANTRAGVARPADFPARPPGGTAEEGRTRGAGKEMKANWVRWAALPADCTERCSKGCGASLALRARGDQVACATGNRHRGTLADSL